MNAELFKVPNRGPFKRLGGLAESVAPISGNPKTGAVTLNIRSESGERYKLVIPAEDCAHIAAFSLRVMEAKPTARVSADSPGGQKAVAVTAPVRPNASEGKHSRGRFVLAVTGRRINTLVR